MHSSGANRARRRAAIALAGLFSAVLLVVATVTATGDTTASSAAPRPKDSGHLRVTVAGKSLPIPGCTDPSKSGALHITKNRLLKANNAGFAYYGLTVFGGLEHGGNDAAWQQGENSAMAQIKASTYWHANTIRLQIAEENVFVDGNAKDGINTPFLDAVCKEVQQVRRQGQEVVISDQTEWPDWTESNPTERTVNFWRVIDAIYGNKVGISYDLYNEPRLNYPKPTASYHGHLPAINLKWVWNIWRNGGKAAGQTFVGMQQLYNDVRAGGINNIIWIEGPFYDDSLGMASGYLIKGKNIVWSIHHPTLTNASNWKKFFGYLAATYPVVDGEFAQYAGTKPECRSTAYKTIPVYLKYLLSLHIGVIGWSLQPGAMLADPHRYIPTNTWVSRDSSVASQLRTPSRMWPNYSCSNKDIGEGAGQVIMNYFKNNAHLPGV
jgi:hypothetical protein